MTITTSDTPLTVPLQPAPPVHAVQFYESEDFLFETVASFFEAGLRAGHPAILIATERHRLGFANTFKTKGLDGHIVYADAREMLATFMDGAMPDPAAFRASIGELIRKTANGGGPSSIRAYGEMVDLLFRDGNAEGAIRLEELWNELIADYSFSLLCAYPMGNFYKETHREPFDRICGAHSHVEPTTEVAMLRQRAVVLETEIAHRKELEKALRDALAVRRRHEESDAFLLEAAFTLFRSLDYETRLGELARLVVPRLAEWCAVDIERDNGTFERVSVAGEISIRPDDSRIVAVLHSSEPQTYEVAGHSVMIVPMRHANGVVGAISFVSKASARRYDDADRALAIELARRAAIAIENARLYLYAQQANRAKDEFLATLSHELRTPLTAILGWARMLRIGEVDKETYDLALETIERSARTQATLIDDILDLSKVVTGKIALQTELVELTAAVNNAIDTVRLAATAKRIEVSFVHPPQPAFVTGDSMRLQQIVWNLLTNAIKFSERDATVEVELKVTHAVAKVIVRDPGIGIRRDFLPHVFEPFRQAEASTTRAFGGLGLGLAIVKYFTEMHGGSIVADSAGEGKGAAFTITLPLAAQHPDDDVDPAALTMPAADLHGTAVLVVDDDDDTRIVIGAAMRNCGAEVRGASSVAQACRLIDQKPPDILLADIAMPHEDGFALIEYVRGRELTRDIPAVAMTAFGLPGDEERILAAGFNLYARKPIEPLQLAALVAQLKK